MENKKSIAVDAKIYQKLVALKKEGESIEDVVGHLVDQATTADRNWGWRGSCKLVVLGPENAGKSMILKSFFENKDPRQLLSDFLLPTKTIEECVYQWLDVKVNVVEIGGVELDRVLNEGAKQAFSKANAIIYVFEMKAWEKDKEKIIADLAKISKLAVNLAPDASIECFIHKVDVLEKAKREAFADQVQANLVAGLKRAGARGNVEIHATSLVPGHELEVFRVLRNLLFKHSSILRQALLPGFLRV
nr:GTPase [Candidatus Sigynarchaeota archaeon]